jgi:hypothetical protein
MSALSIQVPFPVFQDRDGQPLENGYIWLGVANLNPQTNPVIAYYDEALTIVAPQPLRTLNGYISRAGTPAQVYFDGLRFSILVQDSRGSMVYNFLNAISDANSDACSIIYDPPFTNSVAYPVCEKLEQTVSVKDFGAVGDGTADDTAAVQNAINAASANSAGKTVYFPTGKYKLTSAINISASVSILGDEPSAIKIGGGIGGGTFLFFSHTGKGLNITNSGGYYAGVQISQIGTYRTQPVPAPGWTPTAHDFDIFISGLTDINIFNVTLLNPTNGIKQTSGGGRINIDYLKMQAMTKGIVIDEAFDVCRISNVHMWPFWEDDSDVHAWTLANLDGISMGRCDNPMLTNIFTIFANSGIRFYQNASGATSKVHLVNADFDAGINGIRVDNTVTNGVTGQFSNVTHQGNGGSNNSVGVIVAGTSSILSFGSLKTSFCGSNGVRVDGTANRLSFSDLAILYYDQGGTSFPAVEVAANNNVQIALQPFIITAAPGIGPKYGGAGRLSVDDWIDFLPNFNSSTGTITTKGSSNGRYKVVGNTVFVKAFLRITNNGTGAGSLEMSIPYSVVAFPGTGCGREIAVTGKSVGITTSQSVAVAIITNYDNSYPGVSNMFLDVDFSYIIAQV